MYICPFCFEAFFSSKSMDIKSCCEDQYCHQAKIACSDISLMIKKHENNISCLEEYKQIIDKLNSYDVDDTFWRCVFSIQCAFRFQTEQKDTSTWETASKIRRTVRKILLRSLDTVILRRSMISYHIRGQNSLQDDQQGSGFKWPFSLHYFLGLLQQPWFSMENFADRIARSVCGQQNSLDENFSHLFISLIQAVDDYILLAESKGVLGQVKYQVRCPIRNPFQFFQILFYKIWNKFKQFNKFKENKDKSKEKDNYDFYLKSKKNGWTYTRIKIDLAFHVVQFFRQSNQHDICYLLKKTVPQSPQECKNQSKDEKAGSLYHLQILKNAQNNASASIVIRKPHIHNRVSPHDYMCMQCPLSADIFQFSHVYGALTYHFRYNIDDLTIDSFSHLVRAGILSKSHFQIISGLVGRFTLQDVHSKIISSEFIKKLDGFLQSVFTYLSDGWQLTYPWLLETKLRLSLDNKNQQTLFQKCCARQPQKPAYKSSCILYEFLRYDSRQFLEFRYHLNRHFVRFTNTVVNDDFQIFTTELKTFVEQRYDSFSGQNYAQNNKNSEFEWCLLNAFIKSNKDKNYGQMLCQLAEKDHKQTISTQIQRELGSNQKQTYVQAIRLAQIHSLTDCQKEDDKTKTVAKNSYCPMQTYMSLLDSDSSQDCQENSIECIDLCDSGVESKFKDKPNFLCFSKRPGCGLNEIKGSPYMKLIAKDMQNYTEINYQSLDYGFEIISLLSHQFISKCFTRQCRAYAICTEFSNRFFSSQNQSDLYNIFDVETNRKQINCDGNLFFLIPMYFSAIGGYISDHKKDHFGFLGILLDDGYIYSSFVNTFISSFRPDNKKCIDQYVSSRSKILCQYLDKKFSADNKRQIYELNCDAVGKIIPAQNNVYDCGFYALLACEYFIRDTPAFIPSLSQSYQLKYHSLLFQTKFVTPTRQWYYHLFHNLPQDVTGKNSKKKRAQFLISISAKFQSKSALDYGRQIVKGNYTAPNQYHQKALDAIEAKLMQIGISKSKEDIQKSILAAKQLDVDCETVQDLFMINWYAKGGENYLTEFLKQGNVFENSCSDLIAKYLPTATQISDFYNLQLTVGSESYSQFQKNCSKAIQTQQSFFQDRVQLLIRKRQDFYFAQNKNLHQVASQEYVEYIDEDCPKNNRDKITQSFGQKFSGLLLSSVEKKSATLLYDTMKQRRRYSFAHAMMVATKLDVIKCFEDYMTHVIQIANGSIFTYEVNYSIVWDVLNYVFKYSFKKSKTFWTFLEKCVQKKLQIEHKKVVDTIQTLTFSEGNLYDAIQNGNDAYIACYFQQRQVDYIKIESEELQLLDYLDDGYDSDLEILNDTRQLQNKHSKRDLQLLGFCSDSDSIVQSQIKFGIADILGQGEKRSDFFTQSEKPCSQNDYLSANGSEIDIDLALVAQNIDSGQEFQKTEVKEVKALQQGTQPIKRPHNQVQGELFFPMLQNKRMCMPTRNNRLEEVKSHIRAGIQNLGTSCYISSVIQALYETQLNSLLTLVPRVFSQEEIKENSPLVSMQNVFQIMQKDLVECNAIKQLRNSIPEFHDNVQMQDCSEFFVQLTTQCEIICSKDTVDTHNPIKECFMYKANDTICCVICSRTGGRYNLEQYFTPLIFPEEWQFDEPPKNKVISVQDMLNCVTSEAKVDSWCEQCKCDRSHNKMVQFKQIPQYMVFTLSRFVWVKKEDQKGYMKKICHKVDMCEQLSIMFDTYPCSFKLISVIVHVGKLPSTGHYYTFCRNLTTNLWLMCDDRKVTNMQNRQSFNKMFNHFSGSQKKMCTPYMLVYQNI